MMDRLDQSAQKDFGASKYNTSSPRNPSIALFHSNSSCGSCESEDSGYGWNIDDHHDPDLDNEIWSDLFNEIFLRRSSNTKEMELQYIIHELIQTETQYVKTLFFMKKIYYDGMKNKLKVSDDDLATIFPVLDEILGLNKNLLRDLKAERKVDSTNSFVSRIGNVILKHFSGVNGQRFREIYGYFCSRHDEAVALFKAYCREYTSFKQFNKKCSSHFNAHCLSIPECITYMSMRLTKYPLFIEAIIKTSGDSSAYDSLRESLKAVRQVLVGVEEHINAYQKDKQLQLIRKKIDLLSIVKAKDKYGEQRLFKAYNIIPETAELLYDKRVKYRSGHKLYKVRMVIVSNQIIFFKEHPNTKRLQLLDVDNKPPVLLLEDLFKPKENVPASRLDEYAVFIVTKSDIAEVLFDQKKDQIEFIARIGEICEENKPMQPEEDGEDRSAEGNKSRETEQEKEQMRERKVTQAKNLINELWDVDKKIRSHLHYKRKLVQKLFDLTLGERTVYASDISGTTIPDNEILSTRADLEHLFMEVSKSLIASHSEENMLLASPSMISKLTKTSSPEKSSNIKKFYDCQKECAPQVRVWSETPDKKVKTGIFTTESIPEGAFKSCKVSKKMRNFIHTSRYFASDGDILLSCDSSPTILTKLTRQEDGIANTKPRSKTVDDVIENGISITVKAPVEAPELRVNSKELRNIAPSSRHFASHKSTLSPCASSQSIPTKFYPQEEGSAKTRPRSKSLDDVIENGISITATAPVEEPELRVNSKESKSLAQSSRHFASHKSILSPCASSPSIPTKFTCQDEGNIRMTAWSTTVDAENGNVISANESVPEEESKMRRISKKLKNFLRTRRYFGSDEDISSPFATSPFHFTRQNKGSIKTKARSKTLDANIGHVNRIPKAAPVEEPELCGKSKQSKNFIRLSRNYASHGDIPSSCIPLQFHKLHSAFIDKYAGF